MTSPLLAIVYTPPPGAQEHFYLETQASLVVPGEGGEVVVYASTQNPTLTQVLHPSLSLPSSLSPLSLALEPTRWL